MGTNVEIVGRGDVGHDPTWNDDAETDRFETQVSVLLRTHPNVRVFHSR
jgi:hypothetical protein